MGKIIEHNVNGVPVNVWYPEQDNQGFNISYGPGGWMPGIYDSLEAALLGANACLIDEARFVKEVQQPINHVDKGDRLITEEDIKKWLN